MGGPPTSPGGRNTELSVWAPQFIQPDPLQPMTYAYADGDPINRLDPTGMAPVSEDIAMPSDLKEMVLSFGDGWRGAGGFYDGYGGLATLQKALFWHSFRPIADQLLVSQVLISSNATGYDVLKIPVYEHVAIDLQTPSGPLIFVTLVQVGEVAVPLPPGTIPSTGMQPNPRESGHEAILAGEIVAHGAYHALKKELVRAAIMMIAREVLAGVPMGLSEAGALTIESIALGTGGMILTNFAIGAVAGVGVAAEVYLAEAAYRSTAQAVYTVLSKGRDY